MLGNVFSDRPIRKLLAFLVGLSALFVAGCSPAVTESTEPTVTNSPAPYNRDWVEPVAKVVHPLTGMLVASDTITGPSLAAKIDNHNNARPQFGLEQTDIVFEELVEGGLTRYVAVWYTNRPTKAGPVRSIRPMDPDIVSPFGGIITYSGGRVPFVNMMRNTNVYNAIHGYGHADTIYRIRDRFAPHNVVVNIAELVAQNSEIASPGQQFAFADSIENSSAFQLGTETGRIDVTFSRARFPSWIWNVDQSKYLRLQEGSVDKDANGNQLVATNVVVMQVGVDHALGVPRTLLVGSGAAWVSTGGKTIEATWTKATRTAPIRFVDADGVTVRLAPGNTWIELMPTSGSIQLR